LNARFGQNISQGGVGANNPNYQNDNWSVGLQATLPVFTSGARSAEVSRASHSVLQNKYQRENIVELIETRVRTALQKTKGSFPVSRRRIGRLMKQAGLVCKTQKKFKATTDSKHNQPVSPNQLKREFSVSQPDRYYVGDITYVWTLEGWLYLAVVIDLFSRKKLDNP